MDLRQVAQVIGQGPFAASFDSLGAYRTPTWYRGAKFGIFIHWGVYSVPGYCGSPGFGGEWYPRHMYQRGTPEFNHHLEVYGPHKQFGYKDFIPQFKAEKFDPGRWAQLFRDAGAKFVVPVAEHHDGFAMYDTVLSDWCAAKMGPKRDIIGLLAQATREAGLTFGLSSHRAEHWWFFDEAMKFDSDVRDPANAGLYGPAQPRPASFHDVTSPEGPNEAFLQDWLLRSCELVDKYQPQLVWFDWWIQHLAFRPYLEKFGAYYYNRCAQWNRDGAINYKYQAFDEGTAVFDIERGQLAGARPLFWQTDTSVSKNSWGYVKGQDYKTPASLIHDLVDIVSKNGALLLNIGPRPDGTIPEPEQDLLRQIGGWLTVHSEAIYGTRPWVTFGEGPTPVLDGAFTDTKRRAFTSEDIRFTCRGETIYAIALAWPADGRLAIRALAADSIFAPARINRVELLGFAGALRWKQTAGALIVELPTQKPCAEALALRIQ